MIGLLLRLCAIVAAAGLLSAASNGSDSITLEEIIRRNTEAMGGREAIERMRTVEISLHVSSPNFEVDGVYRATRPGRMRIDITAGGKHVFTETFDGEKAWQWQEGKEQKEAGPVPTAALRHGLELPGNLFGLHEMESRGHGVELHGREQIEGTNYYVLRVTLADGYQTSLYVDPQTWRITRRRDFRALHPDIDPTPATIEVRKSDWRQTDGVWFPFAREDVDVKTGKVLETTTVKSIKVNPALDPSIITKL